MTLVFPPEDATDHLQLAQATLTFLECRHSHLPWSACGSTEQVPSTLLFMSRQRLIWATSLQCFLGRLGDGGSILRNLALTTAPSCICLWLAARHCEP